MGINVETGQAASSGDTISNLMTTDKSRLYGAYFGGMLPVASRPGHGVNASSNGTDTWENSRVKHVAPCDISSLSVCYVNYFNGESTSGLATITVRAAVEYNGTMYPFFFFGKRDSVLEAGARGILADPMGVSIPSGATYYIRTLVTVSTAGNKWPYNLNSFAADGEGKVAGTGTASDRTTTGTITAADSSVFTAQNVLANTVSALGQPIPWKVVGTVGDSIMWGNHDTPSQLGWVMRAIQGTCGIVRCETSGKTAQEWGGLTTGSAASIKRLSMLDGCSTVMYGFGVNDLNGGRTLAQLKADQITNWKGFSARGANVITTTLTPWTTSSDSWATTTNQTHVSWESDRLAYNAWVRDGAPLNATTLAAVATGGTGIRIGEDGHPVTSYFDVADLCESARDSGLWVAGGTDDGIHPTYPQTQTIANGFSLTLLT